MNDGVTSSTGNEQIDHVAKDEVGLRARKGAVWSIFQIVGRNLISVGSTAVLARLLSPDDYGLMGMVATLTALLQVFADMGLSWATVQRASLTRHQVSNLFWVNLAVGALLWGVCVAIAPMVADFYHRPELQAVVSVMGATFLIAGIGVQPFALMQRRMLFKKIATIEIASLITGVFIGIAGALSGFGYWSLVAMGLTTQLFRSALALPLSQIKVVRPRRGAGTLSLLSFGGLLALNGLLIYLARNFDGVLIGRWWGAEDLGYYNRAYFLMLLPSMLATGVLTSLMVPSLAAFQNDRERFGSAYRRAVALVALVGSPMAAGLALTAAEAVMLVYGEGWLAVAPMLMWLSLAGITQPIYNTTGWLFTAVGKAKTYLLLTVVSAVTLILGFIVAVPYGATAVAATYGVVMGVVLLGPALWWAHRAAKLRLRDTVRQLLPIFVCIVLMVGAVFITARLAQLSGLGWQAAFSLKVVVGIFVYALAVINIVPRHVWYEFVTRITRKTRMTG